jgi:putative DNA primase/helicase
MALRRPVFANSDLGNAQRLASYFGADLKFVPAWDEFIVWRKTHWQLDRSGAGMLHLVTRMLDRMKDEIDLVPANKPKIKKSLKAWHRASQSRQHIEAVVALVKADPDICVDHNVLDKRPMLLNVRNGTIGLDSGELKKHQTHHLITHCSPVKFDLEAACPTWDAFLRSSQPDASVREFLQRHAGYCLTGDVSERIFVILHGPGKNGKSVYLRALQEVLGPYAKSAPPGLLMDRKQQAHPAEVAALFGARLVVFSEVKQGQTFDEEQFKRLSGNDKISARRMREDFWDFDPTHKSLMAVNDMPRVRDTSKGFWDRVALVPFDVRVEAGKEDKHLLDKLKKELPGILRWAVEGCLEWQRGGLQIPDAVRAATDAYHDREDLVGRYVRERLTLDATITTVTPTQAFMNDAKIWCQRQGLSRCFSVQNLAQRLSVDFSCQMGRDGRAGARGWVGVAIVGNPTSRTTKDSN